MRARRFAIVALMNATLCHVASVSKSGSCWQYRWCRYDRDALRTSGRAIGQRARSARSSGQAYCTESVRGTHSMVGTAGSIGPNCRRYADLPMWIVPSRVSKEPWRAMRVG